MGERGGFDGLACGVNAVFRPDDGADLGSARGERRIVQQLLDRARRSVGSIPPRGEDRGDSEALRPMGVVGLIV